MSGLERQMSQRKKVMGLSERLDVLEQQVEQHDKGMQQVIVAVNTALGQQGQQQNENKEMIDAIIQLVGVAEVQAVIEQNRLNAMKDAAEKTKANIENAVKEGKLLVTDKIGEKTLIVGKEMKKDGTEVPPGFAAIGLAQVKKDFREKLVGQAVGFKMETDTGTFEVLGLYNPAEKPAEPAPAEAPPAAASPEAAPPPAPAAAPAPSEPAQAGA